MEKKYRILIGVMAMACVAFFIWLVAHQSEPVYKGKPLSYWLQAYPGKTVPLDPSENSPTWAEASEAICAMRAQAIPILVDHLKKEDSPAKLKFMSWMEKIGLSFTPAEALNEQAEYAFHSLGSNGAAAFPLLLSIYQQNTNKAVQIRVAEVMWAVDPDATRKAGIQDSIPGYSREALEKVVADMFAQQSLTNK